MIESLKKIVEDIVFNDACTKDFAAVHATQIKLIANDFLTNLEDINSNDHYEIIKNNKTYYKKVATTSRIEGWHKILNQTHNAATYSPEVLDASIQDKVMRNNMNIYRRSRSDNKMYIGQDLHKFNFLRGL